MPIPRSFQQDIAQRDYERSVADVAANTRRLGYVPCAVCGCRATRYVERDGQSGTFRCRAHAAKVPGATHIEPIREGYYDAAAELRYQGRLKGLLLEDESRRDREANGQGVMTPDELALMTIAYDRGINAEELAVRFLGYEPAALAGVGVR